MADTQNTQNSTTDVPETDGFAEIASVLSGFGHTLDAKTKLHFAPLVAKTLATLEVNGTIAVACKGTEDGFRAAINAQITKHPGKVALLEIMEEDAPRVHSHVKTFLKSRKLAATVAPLRKDEDGTPVSFLVRKTA